MQFKTSPLQINNSNALAVASTFAAGFFISPMFTVGTFVNGRKSAVIGVIASVAWATIQWRMATSYVGSGNDGFFFEARNARLSEFALNEAIGSAVIMTLCALAAGVLTRWLYENHKKSLIPISLMALVGTLLIFGQNSLHSRKIAFAEAIGSERGRMLVVKSTQALARDFGQEVAKTDREKLLIEYFSYVSTRKGLAETTTFVISFEEFVVDLASKCIGQIDSELCEITTFKNK